MLLSAFLTALFTLAHWWSLSPVSAAASYTPIVAVAPPQTLTIPTLKLQTPILPVGLNDQDLTAVPPNNVGWYDLGVKPGEIGNAVLVGHTPGIFGNLNKLQPGDQIQIDQQTFTVQQLVYYPVDKFPVATVYGSSVGKNLNLITCAGENNSLRLVVFASKM